MKIRWIDTSCFEIQTDQGERIVTDPYIDECPNHPITADEITAMDYILITHTHFDHITQLNQYYDQYRPKILVSPISGMKLVESLDLSGQCIYGMEDGELLDFGNCAFTRISGHHTIPNRKERHLVRESVIAESLGDPLLSEGPYHALMYSGYWDFSNFYIETKENTRILFWGGSVSCADIRKARDFRPDIILMQIPSNTPEAISEFVKTVGASYVIPHHQDTYLKSRDVDKMMEEYGNIICAANPQTKFLPLEPGKWYEFGKVLSRLF
jgi:L-ascorbate metabolism protein UlaG (beta-lactamase superfamily)